MHCLTSRCAAWPWQYRLLTAWFALCASALFTILTTGLVKETLLAAVLVLWGAERSRWVTGVYGRPGELWHRGWFPCDADSVRVRPLDQRWSQLQFEGNGTQFTLQLLTEHAQRVAARIRAERPGWEVERRPPWLVHFRAAMLGAAFLASGNPPVAGLVVAAIAVEALIRRPPPSRTDCARGPWSARIQVPPGQNPFATSSSS
jgi:hypothetical protein